MSKVNHIFTVIKFATIILPSAARIFRAFMKMPVGTFWRYFSAAGVFFTGSPWFINKTKSLLFFLGDVNPRTAGGVNRMEGAMAGERILIVDDEPNLSATLSLILNRAGYDTSLAANSHSALEAINSAEPFDMVLLDINMPGLSGIDLLPILTNRFPSLPVMILTGSPTMESLQEALNWNIRGYLLKPVNPFELIERVSNLLRDEHLRRKRQKLLRALNDDLKGWQPGGA
jgi:CheY-like chemotaxis protein